MFYGTKDGDGRMRSIATGYPSMNLNTAAENTAIKLNSERTTFLGGAIVQVITDLLLMFSKDRNFNNAYGFGNYSGYDSTNTTTYGMLENAVVSGGAFYGNKT